MQIKFIFPIIAILVTNLVAYNNLKSTGTIAEAVADKSDVDDLTDDSDEIEKEICFTRCRLREHRDCDADTLQCSSECLDGFAVDEKTGNCRLTRNDADNREFMPTEELERVWSNEQKKSYQSKDIEQRSDNEAFTSNVEFIDIGVDYNDWKFYLVVAGCVSVALFGLVIAGICWYRFQKNLKASSDADYPSYGVTGPTKNQPPTADEINAMANPTDRKLAQSAQMYHYQHQKQQMLNVEKSQSTFNKNQSDSEDENEDGDYTVYECPGLAPTGEMEVNNPLFGGHLDSDDGQETNEATEKQQQQQPAK